MANFIMRGKLWIDKQMNALVGGRKVWTHWQWYKDFFNISVFKYFVSFFALLPVVANILIQLPKKIYFLGYSVNLTLPFKWELLWTSAVVFFIAYSLYLFFCPKFIKKYSSFGDYKQHMHDFRWIVWLSNTLLTKHKKEFEYYFKRMTTKKYFKKITSPQQGIKLPLVDVEEKVTTLTFEYKAEFYQFSMPILTNNQFDSEKTELAEKEIFWEIFGRFSSSKRYVRLAIIALLAISTILFTIVLLQNIFSGFRYFVR